MKRTRKGFTLAARATNIADGLEKAASAMMMFYSDNVTDINTNGTNAAKAAAGASAYLRGDANHIMTKL